MISTSNGPSLSLLTDFYQLTMAYAFWRSGNEDRQAVFHFSFRTNPFHGGFAVFCGLTHLINFLQNFRFDDGDIQYLSTLKAADGTAMFEPLFLAYLKDMKLVCDIDSVPEGTVVFAHEPIIRVTGPIIQCQILESILLNIINFQTLIATKASRVRLAAGEKRVIEFGLRRAQGADGALSASWAAYVGGIDSTSNVLAGKLYGIPVSGTHAHSWVMSFDDELASFKAYAEALPNNCVFVDTYNTLNGVMKAVEVGQWLKQRGQKLLGIRLDSGDLAYLSIESRKILDSHGFQDTLIVASNDLDEHIIDSLNDQGAQIDVWGVGTKLITAYDQPSLGGVYKLAAVKDKDSDCWQYKIKLSEQVAKISTPGIQQVRRFKDDTGKLLCDMIFDASLELPEPPIIVDPTDFTRRKRMPFQAHFQDLLVPVFQQGRLAYPAKTANEIRYYAKEQLSCLHPSIKRLLNPHQYPVGLEIGLHNLKTDLILQSRAQNDSYALANSGD